ncbi:hypothetical protein ACFT5C_27920 [Streptomyces sp. NPDC057116]|uniref:hypothetical protein n=1 Tax=Streptomyces sp. NPDC057116 TaxID=3346023 RepID=UPI003635E5C2
MKTRHTAPVVALFAGLFVGVVLSAPAWAGGLGAGVLSPAIGNGCANHTSSSTDHRRTTSAAGAAGGDQIAVSVRGPLNQCGGADIPTIDTYKPPRHLPPQDPGAKQTDGGKVQI